MYKITSTESHSEKATEYETKALLYLINYYKDSNKIHWIVVDFFNDVTGVDRLQSSCFDVQSKGIKDIGPSELGKYLVTLFKNYLSDLHFEDYLLFIQSVGKTIKDQIGNKKTFTINDLNQDTVNSIARGLENEANEKTYIEDKNKVKESIILDFLEFVTFVVDCHSKEEYVKDAVNYNSSLIVDDLRLRKVFKELRDKQSSKKNNNVEGEQIENISGFVCYDKYFRVDDIQMLILNRICFNDFLNNEHAIPRYFHSIYSNIDETIRNDVLEDCFNDVIKVLMDKNNRDSFWCLFENVITAIKNNPTKSIDEIYEMLDQEILKNIPFLDFLSAKYFISLLKERLV